MTLYEVAVAAPIFSTLTYSQPSEATDPLPVGIRVLVPMGSRIATGFLLSLVPEDADPCGHEVKAIASLLDHEPVFPEQLVPFFRWIADYYHYPIGEVVRTALPTGLTVRSGREAVLTDVGRIHLPAALAAMEHQEAWMQELAKKGRLPTGLVKAAKRQPAMKQMLEAWQSNGWVEMRAAAEQATARLKTVVMVRLGDALRRQLSEWRSGSEELPWLGNGLKKSEQKTLDLFFRRCGGQPVLPRCELTKEYSGASRALRGLAEAGMVCLEEEQVYRDPFGIAPAFFARPELLTKEQSRATKQIAEATDAKKFQPFLLHGVTGSGKTEVYLQSAEHCLAQERNVLMLAPELALASQVEAHFHSRFGNAVAVLHSGLSDGERLDQWHRILRREAKIVVGARSAVFAPLVDLGLVIVDEEHEPAYKQDDGLRYNARDMAVLRARFASCPVVLGSATPSVASFHHAEQGRYQMLTLLKRVHDQVMPEVEVVDLSKEKRSRQEWFLSEQLLAALEDNLAAGMQSLLFVNRRGYASFMLCKECGTVVRCQHCRVSLTWHRGSSRLICHYCGYSLRADIVCPECRSSAVVGLGLGSERVEAEVRKLFPNAKVARLDSDAAGSRKAYLTILRQVRDHEVDILVGTQMAAKGLHFPRMTLVGIVWADSGLALPDYKAAERSFQLLAQATGRAGRGDHAGKVVIQTHQPGHYALESARTHAYRQMYEQEKALRKELGYPPFGRLINIRFSGMDEDQVAAAARTAGEMLRTAAGDGGLPVDILGPAPAPLSMIKNRFRWQLLLKSSQPEKLHLLCNQLMAERQRICRAGTRMEIDVDPENMM